MGTEKDSLADLITGIATGKIDIVDAVELSLERIRRLDGDIRAFVWVDEDGARATAHRLADELRHGRYLGPLHGVPVGIKELFDIEGAPIEYGSDVFIGRRADRDAVAVRRLREAGAVVIGATRTHEVAWGITTTHPRRGSTGNPWDTTRIAGGSSGGSAAAVASGMVPIALATDTGGSIRIPSTFCGIAGIKPSYGRVPRSGSLALAPSFDTPGVVARSVGDLWPALSVIAGPDASDPPTLDAARDPLRAPRALRDLRGMRIGVTSDVRQLASSAGESAGFGRAVSAIEELGGTAVDIDLPGEDLYQTYVMIHLFEAYRVHKAIHGGPPELVSGYSPGVHERMLLAARITGEEYTAALERRALLTAAIAKAIIPVTALLSAVSAVPPPPIARADFALLDGREVPLREAIMGFVTPQNLSGLPAVAFPTGFWSDGMPSGLQLTAARGREDLALSVAHLIEGAAGTDQILSNHGKEASDGKRTIA